MAEQVKADPEAAAIADADAEDFFAVAWGLWVLSASDVRLMAKAFGLHMSHKGPKAQRYVVTNALRRWRNPRVSKFLLDLVRNMSYGTLPAANDAGDRIGFDDLTSAYDKQTNIVWLVHFMRNLDAGDAVEGFLRHLGKGAQREYAFWLNVGRLTLRRFADGRNTEPAPRKAGNEYHRLASRLKAQESQSRALRADAERLTRSRRDLARAARRSESELAELLERARAEVSAASEDLRRRQEAQARERAEVAARHAARVEALQRQLAAARREFAAALAERGAASGMLPLLGHRVAVLGDDTNSEGYRLLVESAGGRLVESAAGLTVQMRAGGEQETPPGAFCSPGGGLAEFERLLRSQILPALARHRG